MMGRDPLTGEQLRIGPGKNVDEKGTEAAAATAVAISEAVSAPATVVIDKPFLFAIRDDATGAILFTGRVTNPAA